MGLDKLTSGELEEGSEEKAAAKAELEERQAREEELAARAEERAANFRWDADTLCTTKWENETVVNPGAPNDVDADLVGEAKALQELRVARAAAEGAAVASAVEGEEVSVSEAAPSSSSSSSAP